MNCHVVQWLAFTVTTSDDPHTAHPQPSQWQSLSFTLLRSDDEVLHYAKSHHVLPEQRPPGLV